MWLASLSYLVDIFDRLNGLNLSLQGRETHVLLLADKVHAFTQKLDPLAWPHQSRELRHVPQPCRLYH